MSRFPSPVFWQRGQWRKFKSDELFKKGGTLPSGYHGHHAPSTVKILHRWILWILLQVMEYAEENGGNLAANGSLAFTRKKSDLGKNKKMPYDRQKSPRILPQTCTTLARSTRQAWNFRHGAESSLHSPEHCSTTTEIAISKEIMINNFQGTVSWCFQFMKRKNLTIRQHTTLSKALPEDQEEMIATFQALVSD